MDEGWSLGRVWQGYHCTWWTGRAVQAILALVDSLRDRIPVHLCCGLSLYHFTLGSQSLHCPHCRHVSLPLCSCPQPATYFLGEQGWDGKNEHAGPRDSTGGWASPWCWPGDRMLMEVSRALKSSSPAERLCFWFFFYSSLCTLPCRYEQSKAFWVLSTTTGIFCLETWFTPVA